MRAWVASPLVVMVACAAPEAPSSEGPSEVPVEGGCARTPGMICTIAGTLEPANADAWPREARPMPAEAAYVAFIHGLALRPLTGGGPPVLALATDVSIHEVSDGVLLQLSPSWGGLRRVSYDPLNPEFLVAREIFEAELPLIDGATGELIEWMPCHVPGSAECIPLDAEIEPSGSILVSRHDGLVRMQRDGAGGWAGSWVFQGTAWPPADSFDAGSGDCDCEGGGIHLDGDVLLIAESDRHRIRAIHLADGSAEILAGSGERGFGGDGGDALAAGFAAPHDVALGPDGALYVADTGNHCVRVIRDGVVDTFAGTCGTAGYAGDGGPADEALLWEPRSVVVDDDGLVYIADTGNALARAVWPDP